MDIRSVKEQVLGTLYYSDYNTSSSLAVTKAMLVKAKVGDCLRAQSGNCGRAVSEEVLEIVYKTGTGVAGVLHRFGTTDSPNPEDWASDDEIIWFEFLL